MATIKCIRDEVIPEILKDFGYNVVPGEDVYFNNEFCETDNYADLLFILYGKGFELSIKNPYGFFNESLYFNKETHLSAPMLNLKIEDWGGDISEWVSVYIITEDGYRVTVNRFGVFFVNVKQNIGKLRRIQF